jgi:hypothetical protein
MEQLRRKATIVIIAYTAIRPDVVLMFWTRFPRVEHNGNLTYYSLAGNSCQTLLSAGLTQARVQGSVRSSRRMKMVDA